MRERWRKHPRLRVFSGVIAFLFGMAMVCGQRLNSAGEIPVKRIISWCSLIVVFLECWHLLFWGLSHIRDGKRVFLVEDLAEPAAGEKMPFWQIPLTWFLLLVCWLPSFLAVYPGFFVYDAYEEYMQVATGLFSAHHPLLHVLLLGKTICKMHELTGSYNFGIALYTICQMMAAAACFVYVLYLMKRERVKKIYRRIAFLYFAFFPNVVMFTLCSTKDTLFAAALLLTVLLHMEWQKRGKVSMRESGLLLLLICSQALALLLRNNAVYAFIVFTVLLMIVNRGKRAQTLAVCAVTIGCYLLCSKALLFSLHAQEGGKQEILTVPIQQISRSYHADPSLLSQEEKELLFSYLPEEALARYTPKLSDPVKIHFNNEQYRLDKLSFWRIWLKLFTQNPVGYINAWFMTSYGYWYPDAAVDVYRGNTVFTHTYEDSSYFGFETELPGERNSKLPLLERFYRELSLEDIAQSIPGVSWMFSMGAVFWLYVFCACILVAKKQYGRLLPFAFPAFVWMTLLLGPTYLPRYVVFIWYLLPLMLMETMLPCEAENRNSVRLDEEAGEDRT